MKIAIVRQQYNPFGGAEILVTRTIATLTQQTAIDVHLLARHWEFPPQQPSAINFHTIDPFYLGRLMRDRRFAHAVQRFLASSQSPYFDLVESYERIPGLMLYQAGDGLHRDWLQARRRILSPMAHRLLRIHPYHRYVLQAESDMLQHPELQAVICSSQMVRDSMAKQFPSCRHKLYLVRSGVDLSQFQPAEIASAQTNCPVPGWLSRNEYSEHQHGVTALFIGSGYKRKGLATALAAVAAVPKIRLMVVGRDREIQYFQRLAIKLSIQDRVFFAGQQLSVLPYYQAADILIFPTLYEPFGMVTLEAMACGLPVLTTFSSGATEMIRHQHNGWVMDALDVHAFANALRDSQDRSRRQEMGKAAREAVEGCTLTRMTEQMQDVYRTVTKNRK